MRIITCGFRSVTTLCFSDAVRRLMVMNNVSGRPYLEVHHLHAIESPVVMDKHPGPRWVVGYTDADDRVRLVPHPPSGLNHFLYQRGGVAHSSSGLSADGTRAVVAERSWRPNVLQLSGYTLQAEKWHLSWQRTVDGYYDGPVCFFDGDRRFVIRQREQVIARTRPQMRTQLVVCDAANGRELAISPPVVGEVHLACAFGSGLVVSCNVLQKRIVRSRLHVYPDGAVNGVPLELKQLGTVSALVADHFGRFLYSASGTKVTVWDPATWKPLHKFDWKIGKVTCLAVSPDGTVAAAGGDKGKVAVWDVE